MKQKYFLQRRLIQFRQWSNKHYGAFNSLRKIIKICTLALAYSILTKPLHLKAQGGELKDTSIYELDEVTVQSTLIDQKNAETGRSIEVINSSQLQAMPVTTIDELLRYIPGIEAKSRNAFGVQTDFSVRGNNFNQILVLIDGQKINEPLTAHFNSNIPLSPSEIEKIEIILGPAAAEYGPDATGGVINIITKTFSQKQSTKMSDADAKFQYGQYSLINSQGGINYQDAKFKFGGGFLVNSSDGQTLLTGLKDKFFVNTFSLSGNYKLSQAWSIAVRSAYDKRNFNAQNFYTALTADSASEKITRYRQQIQIARNSDHSLTILSAGLLNTQDHYVFNSLSLPSDNSTALFNLDANQRTITSNNFSYIFGISASQRSIISNNRGDHVLWHSGVYATLALKPFKILSLNAGLRGDYDQNYGFNFLPQVSLSYRLYKKILLRTSIGRSIRAADFTENYYNNYVPKPLYPNQVLGNPYLKAEKSWSYEVGSDYNFLPGFMFSISGFTRFSNNLIDYVKQKAINIRNNQNLADTTYYYAMNIANLQTYGFESRFVARKSISNKLKFSLNAGYTWIKSVNDRNIISLYLASHARDLVNGEFSVEYDLVSMNVDGLYKVRDPQYSTQLKIGLDKSYMVWNTGFDIAIYHKTGFITLSVYNIFNKIYNDYLGAQMPGRWIAGGIKFRI